MSAEEFLCCDLAELFLKLKKYENAEKLLKHALNHEPGMFTFYMKELSISMNIFEF